MSATKDIEAMSFEEAVAALEDVVTHLDSGNVPLDESIRLYENGAKLKARCEALLRAAQEKVEQITLDEQGNASGATPVKGL